MLAASLACLKSDITLFFLRGGGGQIPARAEPLPLFYVQKIRLCGCFILQLALSLDGPYPRKMSE